MRNYKEGKISEKVFQGSLESVSCAGDVDGGLYGGALRGDDRQ